MAEGIDKTANQSTQVAFRIIALLKVPIAMRLKM